MAEKELSLFPENRERADFIEAVYSYYHEAGRSFPWRETKNPWGVLVSEFMLQQTQTNRVINYWNRWMSLWPDASALAAAPMEEVLREWSGLGYNRRARYLKECALHIRDDYANVVPKDSALLKKLPGLGDYSSKAIACFAYNIPSVFIETNIRSAVIHFFFQDRDAVGDKEIIPILEECLDRDNPRLWYWALMDYGAELKRVTKNPSRRSAHYQKQSPFQGSFRQMRGLVIRTLAFEGPADLKDLTEKTRLEEQEIYAVLEKLQWDLMVAEEGGIYRVLG